MPAPTWRLRQPKQQLHEFSRTLPVLFCLCAFLRSKVDTSKWRREGLFSACATGSRKFGRNRNSFITVT